MRQETKVLLEKYIKDCLGTETIEPGLGYYIGLGVSINVIKSMEDELGLKFSDDYVEFLRCYGETCVEGYDVYGYGVVSMHGENSSVVDQTAFYRIEQGWPGIDDWYIVSDDGLGNPIGCKPDGSVWLSDHDCGFEEVKLADSFDDFLYKILTGTMYKDEGCS